MLSFTLLLVLAACVGGAAPKADGGPDEDELVLLEPAVFNDGERPSCPKCFA